MNEQPMIRLSVPQSVPAGTVIEIKVMIQHAMESGYRRGALGERIPRDIIKFFRCSQEGETIFEAEFHPGVAANPLLTFHMRAERSGTLDFQWTDQNGRRWTKQAELLVI
jgi:sulfur-oxidizing protein SoxZ